MGREYIEQLSSLSRAPKSMFIVFMQVMAYLHCCLDVCRSVHLVYPHTLLAYTFLALSRKKSVNYEWSPSSYGEGPPGNSVGDEGRSSCLPVMETVPDIQLSLRS